MVLTVVNYTFIKPSLRINLTLTKRISSRFEDNLIPRNYLATTHVEQRKR